MNIRIFATAVLFSMSSFAAAQELTQEEMARVSEKLQLKEAANQARDFALAFKAFAGQFGEDIVERTAPFNAAAAAKYSAEYSIRALVSPKLEEEFGLVAGNLAYDAVAEAADAAELAAEIAALAKDGETADTAAKLAGYYYSLAQVFNGEVRESDALQSGQRLLRAMHAADRAKRFAARHP